MLPGDTRRIMQPEQRLRRVFRLGVIVLALAGAVTSFFTGQRLHRLRLERQQLAKQVGYLPITDELRIHIAAIPETDDVIPPGIEKAYVWRFRVYLPANYSPYFMTRSHAVSADSPRSRGGGGGSWGRASKEALEMEISVAILKTEKGWMLSRQNGGSSSTSSLSQSLAFDSLDDVIVEPVATADSGARSFSVDDAICLLRIRGKDALEPRDGEPPMYPGFVMYLADTGYRDAMEQWAEGKIDQLPEKITDEF